MSFTMWLDYSFKNALSLFPLSISVFLYLSVGTLGTYSTSNPSMSNLGSQDPSTFNEMGSNHLELKLESIFWFSEVLGSLKKRDWQHNKEGQAT